MNILWDLRLFSYGYRDRGVGTYCTRVAAAIVRLQPDMAIYAWGDRNAAPPELRGAALTWIDYRKTGWKSGIVAIPLLVLRYRIDLIHYWVALGPLRPMGIAPWTTAKTIATVHDLGVELWDTPFGKKIKTGRYWRMQKLFFGHINAILANSTATIEEIHRVFPALRVPCDRVLPQFSGCTPAPATRLQFFITLGGAAHKNCARVVAAFTTARKKHPEYSLIILGAVDFEEEGLGELPGGVIREATMTDYATYLQSASGLLFCSLHEGLGLPPLEAMHFGCPLLLADLQPLRETCADAARFVDPYVVDDIAEGICALIDDNELWATRSRRGAEAYRRLSDDTPRRCLQMYEKVTGTEIRCNDTATGPQVKEHR